MCVNKNFHETKKSINRLFSNHKFNKPKLKTHKKPKQQTSKLQMADTAIKSEEEKKEYFDEPAVLDQKVSMLAEMVIMS